MDWLRTVTSPPAYFYDALPYPRSFRLHPSPPVDVTTRRGFLNLAALFEGGTLLAGLILGWLTGVLEPRTIRLGLADFGWGLLAVGPMLGLLVGARGLRQQVTELVGQPLASCRWHDLAALALLAGLSEELLFRGVLEPWLDQWTPWLGCVVASLLFGLAHALSPSYFIFATLIGIYFSLLSRGWPDAPESLQSANLLRPVVAHAVYDFIAFLVIVREYRRRPVGLKSPPSIPSE